MKYGLGLDTGGTYTDAVVYDFENNRLICSAKSLTDKQNLLNGINGALDALDQEALSKVGLVSLSTTLATNACVEGKGSRAKLILIGCERKVISLYGKEYGLPDEQDIIFLNGGHDMHGRELEQPDWKELEREVLACNDKVDSFAVVELWGILNNGYEKKAKQLIEALTGKLVICGHEITDEINSLRRAASAVLNAQLVGLINEFLDAVKTGMLQRGREIPIVVVKSDGSLMSEAYARQKPVETLLCGPAASVAGGRFLTGEENCIVVDMGGTTTDVALVRNGFPVLAPHGANIGGWKTGVRSINIRTIGLGGDSRLWFDKDFQRKIGPTRSTPLSYAATRWPELKEKIHALYTEHRRHSVPRCEFFFRIKNISANSYYSDLELQACDFIGSGIRSLDELCEGLHLSIYEINGRLERLEKQGIIMRCSLTPTDLMHLRGDYSSWDAMAAREGALIYCEQLQVELNELIESVYHEISYGVFRCVMRLMLEERNNAFLQPEKTGQLDLLLNDAFFEQYRTGEKSPCSIFPKFETDGLLVGIGAPIHVFLKDVSNALGCRVLVHENAGVANAIGAVTGGVLCEETVIVKPQCTPGGIVGFSCFSSDDTFYADTYEEACEWARRRVQELAHQRALEKGAEQVQVAVKMKEKTARITAVVSAVEEGEEDPNQLMLETVFSARAVGKVKWG